MHGVVFLEFQRFLTERVGPDAWQRLARDNLQKPRVYVSVTSYPDQELQLLVQSAAPLLKLSAPEILREFGRFLAPRLLDGYSNLVQPEWRTLELVENTELLIHSVVRRRTPEAEPPQLQVTRVAEDELSIRYTSGRRLCSLARGLVEGFGLHYAERINTSETSCMLSGAPACTIRVQRRS